MQVRTSRPRIQGGGGAFGRRRLVELRRPDDRLHHEQQQRGQDEAEERREQQRFADLRHLVPVDARGAVLAAHQRVGDADADDRADQRMRTRGRQAQPPGAQIPDDRGDEQREHHRVARARADLQNQLDRQQRNDAERDSAARSEHPEEVPAARPDDRDLRRQGVGVDDGRDGVGGVVETVDEFEAERDQHRDAEQQERQDRRRSAAGLRKVRANRIGHVEQAAGEHRQENERKPDVERVVEMRLHRRYGRGAEASVECGGHLFGSHRGGDAHLSRRLMTGL